MDQRPNNLNNKKGGTKSKICIFCLVKRKWETKIASCLTKLSHKKSNDTHSSIIVYICRKKNVIIVYAKHLVSRGFLSGNRLSCRFIVSHCDNHKADNTNDYGDNGIVSKN